MSRPESWVPLGPDESFGPATLPYGAFTTAADPRSRIGVRIGGQVLDVRRVAATLAPRLMPLLGGENLDGLLAAGPQTWARVRSLVAEWVTDRTHRPEVEPHLVDLAAASLRLPFTVADYVDFYSSERHATNVAEILRPGQDPLPPAWKHLPIGYHGRAGTVVVSGTEVVRPLGQRRSGDGDVVVGPTERLDLEAEVGFVVGTPSPLGRPVPLASFADHVFGVCLVNDWSARDLQAFEYRPLGPFLAKSFLTSVSPWVVPLAALEHARVRPPDRDPRPAAYLDDTEGRPWGLDLTLEVRLNGHVVSRPPAGSGLYWTAAQQLAHLTSNGASLRTGDLYASGTVSGPDDPGSLLELTRNGTEPIRLPDGSTRGFLADGDEVTISATAPGPAGSRIDLGEVSGRVRPSR